LYFTCFFPYCSKSRHLTSNQDNCCPTLVVLLVTKHWLGQFYFVQDTLQFTWRDFPKLVLSSIIPYLNSFLASH
jgi:hypothetical protein